MPVRKIFAPLPAGLLGCALLACPAAALPDLSEPPLTLPVGDAELKLDAQADGAVMAADQPGEDRGATGVVKLMPRLARDYDSGLVLSLDGTLALADPLSRGRYPGPVQKLYGALQTGLGTLQVGLTDGAGYALGLTGPRADPAAALEDGEIGFFRDPRSHRALTDMFALRTAVGASSNFAKFAWVSPALFGAQLAFSYTPGEGRLLPFQDAGPDVPGRQTDIYELALRYGFDVGPVSLGTYLAGAVAHGEHKLPGQQGLGDFGAGLKADYPVDDELTLSLGGSYRTSNAYAFDINRAYAGASTRALHVSMGFGDGNWSGSLEYGNGAAGAVPGAARLGLNGLEASLGYALGPGVTLGGGWQHLNYGRDAGAFYDGSQRLSLDAAFLHLSFRTTD